MYEMVYGTIIYVSTRYRLTLVQEATQDSFVESPCEEEVR